MKRFISLTIVTIIAIMNQLFLTKYISYDNTSILFNTIEDRWKLIHTFDNLIEALIHVESSGNHCAYNASTDAVGCLQICPIMVREVNNILKTQNATYSYQLEDRWDCDSSREMFEIWASHYHENSSYERISRNWNGGPRGYVKTATEVYWDRVKKYLESN